MTEVLMRMGDGGADFTFAIDTAAHQSLTRAAEHRWPVQERLWNEPAVQYTGSGAETLELEGVVYPHFRGGIGQIQALRELARRPILDLSGARALVLVTGYGEVLGEWVLLAVEETQSSIGTLGAPLAQRFRLRLQRYVRDFT